MTLPNFLVIGAYKSGTTSLYYYLGQHPQIYMSPVKEPSFFAFEGAEPDCYGPWKRWAARDVVTDIAGYEALFEGVSGELAIGEASPVYLVHPRAAERIKHHLPDAKLIAVLRNPADRAYSAYLMRVLYTGEQPDFMRVVRGEGRNTSGPQWVKEPILDEGFYCAQLTRYFHLFDRSQIQVHLYEDLQDDPLGMLRAIFRFLGVDDTFSPDFAVQHMAGGMPRSRWWAILLAGLIRAKHVFKPFVPAALRQRGARYLSSLRSHGLSESALEADARGELLRVYKEDILNLQDLIQRDLSAWLKA